MPRQEELDEQEVVSLVAQNKLLPPLLSFLLNANPLLLSLTLTLSLHPWKLTSLSTATAPSLSPPTLPPSPLSAHTSSPPRTLSDSLPRHPPFAPGTDAPPAATQVSSASTPRASSSRPPSIPTPSSSSSSSSLYPPFPGSTSLSPRKKTSLLTRSLSNNNIPISLLTSFHFNSSTYFSRFFNSVAGLFSVYYLLFSHLATSSLHTAFSVLDRLLLLSELRSL